MACHSPKAHQLLARGAVSGIKPLADISRYTSITEPTHWPANERPSVGMILAGINNKLDIAPLASAILRALWAEDLNITDEKTLIKIAEDNGFDGANLIQKSRNKELDLQWIVNANDALDSGVFGAPTYVLETNYSGDRTDFSF